MLWLASTTGFKKRNLEYSNMGKTFHIFYSVQETYGTLINLILKPRSQKKPSYFQEKLQEENNQI